MAETNIDAPALAIRPQTRQLGAVDWLRRFFRRLTFPGPHFRPGLVGSAVPWLVLIGYRLYVAHNQVAEPPPEELLYIQMGDVEFWTNWAFGWGLVLSLVDPGGSGRWRQRVAFGVRVAMHLLTATVFLLSLLDLQFFDVTGSRADWDAVGVLVRDLPQFWPVVTSEFKPVHAMVLVVVGALAMAPIFWKGRDQGSMWRALAWLLVMPTIVLETEGRPKATQPLKTLTASLAEHMYWDGIDRLGDVEIAPDPSELTPITVKAGPSYRPFNIVLVLLESVSAKRTTPYTPDLPSTPNLEKLAQEGVAFQNFYAVVPHTSKALVTTLCGDWPRLTTQVAEARPGGLPGNCLPHLLQSIGYRAAFFQSADEQFEDRFRLIHLLGFDDYRARDSLPTGYDENNYFGLEDKAMLQPGLEWSAQSSDQPFLAVYLTLTSHHEYISPRGWPTSGFEGYKGKEAKQLNAIRYVDDFVGQLVEGYRQRGLADNTLFIFMGDHGEGFGEHGRNQHDLVIWDEGLQVPAIFVGPPLNGKTGWIEGDRQQIDLVPTLLNMLGVEVVTGTFPGADLFSPAPERTLYHSCWRSHRCLASRVGEKKFIDHYRERAPQYFNLKADPEEKKDRLSKLSKEEQTAAVAALRAWRSKVEGLYDARMERFLEELSQPDARPAQKTWGEKIESLGCNIRRTGVPVGSSIWVDCDWRAREEVKEGWKIRTRLTMGERVEEDIWFPLDGSFPTWRWVPGNRVPDSIRLKVPPDVEPGTAKVEIGWFRLGQTDQPGDWLDAGTVTLLPRGERPAKDP